MDRNPDGTIQTSRGALREHSQVSSDNSSDSGIFMTNHNLNRQSNGPQRGSRAGHRGRGGGNRTYSSSSGSSGGRNSLHRPVLTPPPTSPTRITPPDLLRTVPVPAQYHGNSAMQRSSFTLNGHQINENYTNRPTTASESQQNFTTSSLPHGGNRHRHSPVTAIEEKHWAYQQEEKIRLLGLPKACWTKEVYQALVRYGNVVRIEIQRGALSNNAFVTFRPPPPNSFPKQQILVAGVHISKNHYEFNQLVADSIDFGIADTAMSMIAMRTVEARARISITLNLKKKELDVQFPLETSQQNLKFRFSLPISLLSHVYKVSNPNFGRTYLIIPFDLPPRFFVQKKEGGDIGEGRSHSSFSVNETLWNDWDTWFRETDVIDCAHRTQLKESPLMNYNDSSIIDIGRWTNYRLSFDDATLKSPKYLDFSRALADYGVLIEEIGQYDVKASTNLPLRSILQDEIAGTHPHLEHTSKAALFDDLIASQISLSFSVRYQLEACLSNGYLKEHTITSNFLQRLVTLEPRRAEHILEKVFDKQHIYYNPMDIFQIRVTGNLDKKVPSYCTLQRSVVITPTRMYVSSPVMETSNRILRKHSADANRFIRVKFSDEKTEGLLRNMPNDRAEAMFDRVRRALLKGIVVAGRYYEFLAFGNSQFREHGAYFYAQTPSTSADDIRLNLGTFHHIKSVSKLSARLGQCFSSTRAMGLEPKIVSIPDIERNGYNFTDGVGKISRFLAQIVAQELGLSNAFDDPPSLYQFRLSGCKGVLSLDPNITGNEVHIRPSQRKFESKSTRLEIIRCSALATPFFNRQIITVLSNLGVRNQVFIRKQQEMINDYKLAMTNEQVAIRKLQKHIDMNQTTLTMAGMVLDGFMKIKDPFFMSLLRLWRACTIKNLKEKARIAIEDGAFLLGCVDETSTLRGHVENMSSGIDVTREEKLANLPEIFVQIEDTSKKGHYKILEGICILARNPSLHPGDLRVVRAINVPTLHHLKNVVVLPSNGDRDLASMCSGGDLDGDDYMVLWDEDLLPEIINVPPMDFSPEILPETNKPLTIVEIGEFFVTYMKNNSLGQIAHAHLAQADLNAEGVNSDMCLQLAKLHSRAVDYPKSGIPAVMERHLRPPKWPHFMEKKHLPASKIYTSRKILGLLYDQVQLVDFKPQWESAFDERILNAFELDENILNKAAEIKTSYDQSIKRLMVKHGIQTEFEAWSVFVLAHNHESNDYKFAEEFGRTISALKTQFRETCLKAAEVETSAELSRLGPFVAAMYTITARELGAALEECHTIETVNGEKVPLRMMDLEHMPLISFPWLFPSELGKIATRANILRPIEPGKAPHCFRDQHKDLANRPHNPEATANVETKGGMTHYGELLNLDFGPVTSESKSIRVYSLEKSEEVTEDAGQNHEKEISESGVTTISATLQELFLENHVMKTKKDQERDETQVDVDPEMKELLALERLIRAD